MLAKQNGWNGAYPLIVLEAVAEIFPGNKAMETAVVGGGTIFAALNTVASREPSPGIRLAKNLGGPFTPGIPEQVEDLRGSLAGVTAMVASAYEMNRPRTVDPKNLEMMHCGIEKLRHLNRATRLSARSEPDTSG